MKVDESTPSNERLDLIHSTTSEAAEILEIDLSHDTPLKVMEKVNSTIIDLVFGRPSPLSEDEYPHVSLGCLWGSQMARQFDWYWANVKIDDTYDEVALISPNREMIIFPFSFIRACIDKLCISTVLLAFNMLLENDRIGEIKPGTYENIMLNIHHIIPPYTLDDMSRQ